MNHALKLVAERDVQAEAQAASLKLRELIAIAERAEQRATTAQGEFESDPSPKTLNEREISAQLFRNARKEADTFCDEIQALLGEAARARNVAELDGLRRRLREPALFAKARDRLADVIATFKRDLSGAILDLQDTVIDRNANAKRATELARSFNTGDDFGEININEEIEIVISPMRDPDRQYTGVGWLELKAFNPTGRVAQEIITFELKMRGSK